MKIAIIGMGYVGIPLAYNLSKNFETIGYDIDKNKINELKSGNDCIGEYTKKEINESNIKFTYDSAELKNAEVFIVCVPTPIDIDKKPNLSHLESATKLISKKMNKNSLVIYESTVYPGLTEDFCGKIIEEAGFKLNKDYYLGYSPERVNPGDKINKIDKIVKLISCSDSNKLDLMEKIYGSFTKTHRVESIKIAEASKAIENAQRDINIAFMNELKNLFKKTDLDFNKILSAAKTKWNFLNFYPGLVGGHCIPVDPYYLAEYAKLNNFKTDLILSGRKINDEMYLNYKKYIKNKIKGKKLILLGLTFKENVNDFRSSQAIKLAKTLNSEYEIKCYDPYASEEFYLSNGLSKASESELSNDKIPKIILVNHSMLLNKFKNAILLNEL